MANTRVLHKRRKNTKVFWKVKAKKVLRKMPIFIVIALIGFILFSFLNLPIKVDIINHNKNINTNTILHDIKPFLTKFSLDLQQIRTTIIQYPWVKDITIKRIWNALTIKIIPQKIQFNWTNLENNNKGYFNQEGVLFIPKTTTTNHYETIISSKKNATLAFNHLQKYQKILKVEIKQLIINDIETLVLKNGAIVILGLKLQSQRLKKLQKYYHFFKVRHNSIIDLRYPHGFAKTN